MCECVFVCGYATPHNSTPCATFCPPPPPPHLPFPFKALLAFFFFFLTDPTGHTLRHNRSVGGGGEGLDGGGGGGGDKIQKESFNLKTERGGGGWG